MDNGRTTPDDTRTPDFLKRSDGKKIGTSEESERRAEERLRAAEDNASDSSESGGLYNNGGSLDAGSRGGFFKGSGKSQDDSGKKSGKGVISKAPMLAIGGIVLIFVVALGLPVLRKLSVGWIKENTFRSTGFTDTAAILEELSIHTVAMFLKEGKMPDQLAADFLENGVEVGQVTIAGEFVRTNEYIAGLDSGLATTSSVETMETGELAVRFGNEIVKADDFVAKIESTPEMYAAVTDATDIAARYYYSDEVNQVYKNMGIERNTFRDFESTGDAKEDQKQFDEMMAGALDRYSSLDTVGQYNKWEWRCVAWDKNDDCADEQWVYVGLGTFDEKTNGTNAEKALALTGAVAAGSFQDNDGQDVIRTTANENAAQLLNTTLQSNEPYSAAAAFGVVIESIERAQVRGDGPVNELMNTLMRGEEVTYTDVTTGEEKTSNKPIIDTQNFLAAVSGAEFSKEEALNFSRDRILYMTGQESATAVTDTVVTSNGEKMSGQGFVMNNLVRDLDDPKDPGAFSADSGVIGKASGAIKIGIVDKNSETFQSEVGGNRIVDGALTVSNTINQQVLAAMPSTEAQVLAYQKEVDVVLARQAEADKATKSPLDISSPHTFLGSLVRKIGAMAIRNYGGNKNVGGLALAASTVGSLASDSVKSLNGDAMAENSEQRISGIIGQCVSVKTTSAACGAYGGQINTIYTGYMDYDQAKFESILPAGTFDKDGEIDPNSELAEGLANASNRRTNFGPKSYQACELLKEKKDGTGIIAAIKKFISVVFKGASDLEEPCNGLDESEIKKATGEAYVNNGESDNFGAIMSAYVAYDTVRSLLEEKESKTARLRHKIYDEVVAEHEEDAKYSEIAKSVVGL
ncbi:hypothetical protein IJJ39_01185 [Candidatus Saccharibacteria bacterium]|nr:hypothetical protein [Candidatus Saccharibacteria bacterium]